MKSKEYCFLDSPEWQSLIPQSPWPFHSSQPRCLSLRLWSRLHVILVGIPSLVIDISALDVMPTSQSGMEERLESLDVVMRKATRIFSEIRTGLPSKVSLCLFLVHHQKKFLKGALIIHISFVAS